MSDLDILNSDWMRVGEWDLPTTWAEFYEVMDNHVDRDELPDEWIENFMTLPAAAPMPKRLRTKVEAFLAASTEERDAMRP